MDNVEKGQRYARLFRKAGAFLAKADFARAAQALSEGETLARALGDHVMACRFAQEIERVRKCAGQRPE